MTVHRFELRPFVLPSSLLPNNVRATRTADRQRRRLRADATTVIRPQVPRLPDGRALVEGPAWCRVTIGYERERTRGATGVMRYRRHADQDNLLAACKGLIDSLQDANVIADDKHLSHAPPVQERDPDGLGYVIIEVWEDAT